MRDWIDLQRRGVKLTRVGVCLSGLVALFIIIYLGNAGGKPQTGKVGVPFT